MFKPFACAVILSQSLDSASFTINQNNYYPHNNIRLQNKSTLKYNYITTEEFIQEVVEESFDIMLQNSTIE
jgi:hypothetical protein